MIDRALGTALLPKEALASWRALELRPRVHDDPVRRVRDWLDRLAARAWCSGGRLTPLLIATGLCDVEMIADCVRAQIDAGPVPSGPLFYDVESDLDDVAELGSLDLLETFSARLATLDWLDVHCGLHSVLAARLLEAGRESEIEAVLDRIPWHGPLLDWLERHGASLSAAMRERLMARAARMISSADGLPVYAVGLYVRFAVLAGDRTWLDRAHEVLVTLSEEAIENAADVTHPRAELAWGLARLGAFDEALSISSELDAIDHWSCLLRILRFAPSPAIRAALVDELAAGIEPLGRSWWQLLEEAPETAARCLAIIKANADEDARLDELNYVAQHLAPTDREPVLEWMVHQAKALTPDSPRWARRWERVLEALIETGRQALLDIEPRRSLIDALLARSGRDVWIEAREFVPDDRVAQALEYARNHLALAAHYTDREAWIEIGEPLLARASPEEAARFLEVAAAQLPFTPMEGRKVEKLAPWSTEQKRAIVSTRLLHHQREFLPRYAINPWLEALASSVPERLWPHWDRWIDERALARARVLSASTAIVPATEHSENAEARRAFEALTATTAWLSTQEVVSVFMLLGRCEGEAVLASALAELVEVLERMTGRGP